MSVPIISGTEGRVYLFSFFSRGIVGSAGVTLLAISLSLVLCPLILEAFTALINMLLRYFYRGETAP